MTRWFVNRGTKSRVQADALPWFPLLQHIHKSRNPRPRRRTTVQQFMLDYPDLVNATFVSQHADGGILSGHEKMNLLYAVAKKMLVSHYSHLEDELEKTATAHHKEALSEWTLALEDVFLSDDVVQCVFFCSHISGFHLLTHWDPGLAIPFLMRFTPSSKPSVLMPGVMSL